MVLSGDEGVMGKEEEKEKKKEKKEKGKGKEKAFTKWYSGIFSWFQGQ